MNIAQTILLLEILLGGVLTILNTVVARRLRSVDRQVNNRPKESKPLSQVIDKIAEDVSSIKTSLAVHDERSKNLEARINKLEN